MKNAHRTIVLAAWLLVCLFAAVPAGAAEDEEANAGKIILSVDDKAIEIVTDYCVLLNTDADYADGYELVGDDVSLRGRFDLNEDGEHDGDDKVEYDPNDESLVPESIVGKSASVLPTSADPEAAIAIPGWGKCQILSGDVKIKMYRTDTAGGAEDQWSGTIELRVRTPKGEEHTVSGTFQSEIVATW